MPRAAAVTADSEVGAETSIPGKTPEGIADACRLHLESILGTLPA